MLGDNAETLLAPFFAVPNVTLKITIFSIFRRYSVLIIIVFPLRQHVHRTQTTARVSFIKIHDWDA